MRGAPSKNKHSKLNVYVKKGNGKIVGSCTSCGWRGVVYTVFLGDVTFRICISCSEKMISGIRFAK